MFKGFGNNPKISNAEKLLCAFNALGGLIDNKAIKAGESLNRLHIIQCKGNITKSEKAQAWEVVNVPIRWDLLCPGNPNLVPMQAFTIGPKEQIPLLDISDRIVMGIYDLNTKILYAAMQINGPHSKAEVVACKVSGEELGYHERSPEVATALERITGYALYKSMLGASEITDPDAINQITEYMAKEIGVEPRALTAC